MSDVIDHIDLEGRAGFDLRAHIQPDVETSPLHFDGHDAEQIAAFYRGEWDYVGLVVTASRAGIDLGSSSVWAVEHGHFPVLGGVSYVRRFIDPLRGEESSLAVYAASLIDEAVAEARTAVEHIIATTDTQEKP